MGGIGRVVIWVVLCGLLLGPSGCTRIKPPRIRAPFSGVPTVAAPAPKLPGPTAAAPTSSASSPAVTPTAGAPAAGTPMAGTPATATPEIPGPTPTIQTVEYVVQPGETLTQIATQHGTTVKDILFWNPTVPNQDSVQAGMRLVVPLDVVDSKHTHTVQFGENLTDIAYRYGVSIEAILQANGLQNPNLLKPGQELVIPE